MGVEEDAVMTAAGMLLRRGGGWTTRLQGGADDAKRHRRYVGQRRRVGIFPRRQRDANGCGDAAVPSDRQQDDHGDKGKG